MDDQKHYIIVDNETYEMYDGDGSFYVTKANHLTDLSTQNTFCTLKEPEKNFLENIILPVSVDDSTTSTGQQHLEPIMIHDYGNMNYFTQAASDVTIYLNSNNENTFMQGCPQSGYFVESNDIIDLTSSTPIDIDTPESESTLDINTTIQSRTRDDLDEPEYIDISKLKLSYVEKGGFDFKKMALPNIICKKTAHGSTDNDITKTEITDSDDDVIFVKEFKASENIDISSMASKKLVGEQESAPGPRRNPKRRVQMIKESFDLALKLSDEEIYCGKPGKSYKDCCVTNSRRSSRNTGAFLRSPIALSNEDYKEWPTEGLHEQPVFNMATKKIEKFDFKPIEEKPKAPVKKNNTNKSVKSKKPIKKGKKRGPLKINKRKKEVPEKGISEEFALLTHETVQEVMKYVSQVKEYNDIVKGSTSTCNSTPRAETGSIIDDARSLLDLVRSDSMEKNLNDAVDILTDSCLLYSLANNVCQGSVATYLKSVKENS